MPKIEIVWVSKFSIQLLSNEDGLLHLHLVQQWRDKKRGREESGAGGHCAISKITSP